MTGDGVRFTYRNPDAKNVYLAGNFNDWAHNAAGRTSDAGALMTRDQNGAWTKVVPLTLAVAKYKFVVEDQRGQFEWRADPSVSDRDRDGNSVVLVAGMDGGPEYVVADTPSVSVRVFSASGRACVVFKDERGLFRDVLVLPRFAVDGVEQLKLNEQRDARGLAFPGMGATLSAELMSLRAVALTWRCNDDADHDLQARFEDNSRYYGGGERFNAINQKGNVLWMASSDHPEDKGLSTYKPVPFVMSSRGYGVWLDSTSPSTFDLNASDRENVVVKDRNRAMRLVVIAGPALADVLAEFTRLTGRPQVPPAWAFAPWKSRDVHFSREQVIEDAELSRKHGLPASVIVLDSPWETGYNDFVLNEQQFARPDDMFAHIRRLGFVPCLWLTPFINQTNVTDMKGILPGATRNFDDAVANGYLVRKGDGRPMIVPWWKGTGGLVDFTNPAATVWWQHQLEQTLRWGVAALKCDDGESNFVRDARFFDGSRAADMKGRYAQLYLQAAHDFLEKNRPANNVLIARCGFTGTGKFPFGWAGDNEGSFSFDNGLPGVILAAQNASLSGLPLWGSDIAGYMGDATPEVFARWTQVGAFSPLMMVHMTSNKGPWDFGDRALDIYRTYSRLHTRLYPYIDNAAREASDRGMPIIRPMVLAFPDDKAAAEQRYEYLFGPDLLVAPMYQEGTRRSVYLPAGRWTDYWSGDRVEGPATVEAEAPLEITPLYVRDGAIIPMLPDDVQTLVGRSDDIDPGIVTIDDRRVLEIWPGDAGHVETSDGLTADVVVVADAHVLSVVCDRAKPVELRFRFVGGDVTLTGSTAGVESSREGDAYVVKLPNTVGFIATWK